MIYEDRERCTYYPWLARGRDEFLIVAKIEMSATLRYRERETPSADSDLISHLSIRNIEVGNAESLRFPL